MIVDFIILEPYNIKFYVIATENKKEDDNSESLISKIGKSIGIIDSFDPDDVRPWDSAFDHGYKNNQLVAAIYIHNKKISFLSLLHELIHCLNWINSHFNISSEYGKDEAVAYFFEYLVENAVNLLKQNSIRISNITKYGKSKNDNSNNRSKIN